MNIGQLQIALPTGSLLPLAAELPVALRQVLANWAATGVCLAGSASPQSAERLESAAAADSLDGSDVQASLGGDGDAYARLIQRHQQEIAVYMWRFTRARGEWEELVHDVFVEAYLSLPGYRARSPWSHWLKRIATRVGYRFWKRRRRQRERVVPLSEAAGAVLAAPDDSTTAQEAGRLVHALLTQLSPRDRLVMSLKYLEGCTTAEIADLTGWSETMVKVQTHRARKRLRILWARTERSA